jgi:uncharacterized lipoprotein YajG
MSFLGGKAADSASLDSSSHSKMLMRKTLITLLAAGSVGMICSCSKPQPAANSTPDPNVPSRAQKQQQAISKASEELRKQKEGATPADEKAPPMTSPTP